MRFIIFRKYCLWYCIYFIVGSLSALRRDAFIADITGYHDVEKKVAIDQIGFANESELRDRLEWTPQKEKSTFDQSILHNQGKLSRFLKMDNVNQWINDGMPDPFPQEVIAWIKEHKRRAAIFQGSFSFYTNSDLDKEISKLTTTKLPFPAHMDFIIFDPAHAEQADVVYLMSQKSNKYCYFQTASTPWGPLEGGMFPFEAYLTKMLPHAVQGEDAAIATAGASLYKKYFTPNYYYLFDDVMPWTWYKNKPTINFKNIEKYKYDETDIKKIGIAIHSDVVVSSGFGGKKIDDQLPTLDFTVNINTGKIEDTGPTQLINLIHSTAYNTGPYREYLEKQNKKIDPLPDSIEDFYSMILQAAYEATCKVAYLDQISKYTELPFAQPRKIYLTLLGGGAFRNNIVRIAEAIERMKNFIRDKGLSVVVLYRPDKIRKSAIRNPGDDITFISLMLNVKDFVNQTNISSDPEVGFLINDYVTSAYAYEKTKDALEQGTSTQHQLTQAQNACSKLAQTLQQKINQVQKTPPLPPAPPIVITEKFADSLNNLTTTLQDLGNALAP